MMSLKSRRPLTIDGWTRSMDTSQAVIALFDRMRLIWTPDRVRKKWPEETIGKVVKVWQRQLGNFSPQTIAAATQAMIDQGLEHPPDLPVFKALCYQNQRGPAYKYVGLPAPYTDREVAKKRLAELKAAMK